MKPLIKEYFRWTEPKDYCRLKDNDEVPRARRFQLLCFLFIFAILMLRFWLASKTGKVQFSMGQFTVIAIFFSAVLTFGLPWIVLKCPSYVKILEKCVFRTRGNTHLRVEFVKLDSFRWIAMSQWSVLMLVRKTGRNVCFGVPQRMPRDEISSFLEQHGLRKEPDAHWSDFEELGFLRNAV